MEFLVGWKMKLIAAAIAVAIVTAFYLQTYYSGKTAGALGCQAAQATAQINQTKKVNKTFQKVKNAAPPDDDDYGVARRLLERTVRQ